MSRYHNRFEWIPMAILVIACFAFPVGIWVIGSHFEAVAYERLTGKRVNLMDAMFLDLRVQEGVKE